MILIIICNFFVMVVTECNWFEKYLPLNRKLGLFSVRHFSHLSETAINVLSSCVFGYFLAEQRNFFRPLKKIRPMTETEQIANELFLKSHKF